MLAFEIRPGMTIRDGKAKVRVLELPFPCSPFTKVHIKVERNTPEGKKTEHHCYDRMAVVE